MMYDDTMARLVSLIVMFQLRRLTHANYQVDIPLNVHPNKALYGYSFDNISGITRFGNCLPYCLANCLCMSFQMCVDAAECQLCATNEYLKSEAMQQSQGCTNYDFRCKREVEVDTNQQCHGLTSVFDCCTTSNPCLNGGTCLPPALSSRRKRFRCKCPDGYEGERCEVKLCESGYTGQHCEHRIRSCRGYSNGCRIPGKHTVFDNNNRSFKVYCDFDRNSPMTWTLIQSYSLKNNKLFKNKPLYEDSPQNENHPSWLKYRLSKSRMESIQSDSAKWRVTCRYETDGVNYTDYLRSSKAEMNILTFIGSKCVRVEYINVRGQNCTDCTAGLWQKHNIYWNSMLHFNSKRNSKCTFSYIEYKQCRDNIYEDNFGVYYCKNSQHRCSVSDDATTQTWLGGEY